MGPTSSGVWWDADPLRELLDGTRIDKYGAGGESRLLTGSGVASNNGTKSTLALSADLFGDWREEVIWRTGDNRALRIYTTIPKRWVVERTFAWLGRCRQLSKAYDRNPESTET